MVSKAKENLIAARAIIADKSRWTQGDFAVDSNGDPTDSVAPEATCFCALGALYKVANHSSDVDSEQDYLAVPGYMALTDAVKGWSVAAVNDGEDHPPHLPEDPHAAILAIYDKAIEATP